MNEGKVTPELGGVPETLLWPLYNRASEARRADSVLKDSLALKLADSIDYPFEKQFGPPDEAHVLRALRFDDQVRLYLKEFPETTVVALGEGLETQFWRVDNGRVKWLVVDLPETVKIRRKLLPECDRYRCLSCSALDFRWMDQVDPSRGVFVTAQGLLMYFEPSEVRDLIATCAARFPGGRLLFDAIPRWFSESTLRGYQKTRAYQTPRMPFGMDVNEIPEIRSFHANIVDVREIDAGRGRSFHFRYKIPFMKHVPIIRNRRTSFVLVSFGQARQRTAASA
jgi:O-methyltransferase involved in polyketide biosynthesis